MNVMEQTVAGISTYGSTAVMTVVGLLALILAFKVVKFIFKLVFGLIALALLGGAIWWFLQGH
jgi:hypothetical protein